MKKIILILPVVLVAFFAAAQSTCNNYSPVVSPNGQHLYFSSDRHGGNYEIYRSDLDGVSNLQRLTNTSVNNFYPSISPDGSKVVFQSGDYGAAAEIYIMNANGTGLTRLTNNSGYDGFPNFSPNGQKIVFDAWDEDAYPEIFTMNADGSNRTRLTHVAGAYWQCSPLYNPSGTYIYFSLGYNADNHLARMNLDGSNIIDITPSNSFGYTDFGMRFTPDGSHIIFSTTDWAGYNNGSDIVIADTMGGNWNRITTSSAGVWFYNPYWHPTNNKIYYGYYTPQAPNWQIYTMSSSGTNNTLLTGCLGASAPQLAAGQNLPGFYPNPVAGELNLILPAGTHAQLFDAPGHLVLSTTQSKIDVSALKAGFYTIRFINSQGQLMQTSKLIKE